MNDLPFDEWWDQVGSEIDTATADEIKELARDAFEAGGSFTYRNINR